MSPWPGVAWTAVACTWVPFQRHRHRSARGRRRSAVEIVQQSLAQRRRLGFGLVEARVGPLLCGVIECLLQRLAQALLLTHEGVPVAQAVVAAEQVADDELQSRLRLE